MSRLVLSQIRTRYVLEGRSLETDLEAELRADPRPGARAILDAIEKRRYERRSEGQRLRKMLRFETQLWATGITRVAGVDEAGMSPLAGPVAAAAVVFAPGSRIPGVDDSKKLDARTRDELAVQIKETCVAWSVAFAEVEEACATLGIEHRLAKKEVVLVIGLRRVIEEKRLVQEDRNGFRVERRKCVFEPRPLLGFGRLSRAPEKL